MQGGAGGVSIEMVSEEAWMLNLEDSKANVINMFQRTKENLMIMAQIENVSRDRNYKNQLQNLNEKCKNQN